jgi:hypothetical protein
MRVVWEWIWTGENVTYSSASFMDVKPHCDFRKLLDRGLKMVPKEHEQRL